MTQNCEICFLLTHPAHEIMMTSHWRVSLSNNQAYLGRAYITLRDHKGLFGELTVEEWQEFSDIVAKLENAYIKAFDASPISWGSYMDHAYREDQPEPHIHWHIFPRYKRAVQVNGIDFDDPLYGDLFDHTKEKVVNDETILKIIDRIKIHLPA